MKEILVLGMGNRLMMDDGIGVYVVETLVKRNTSPKIHYVIGETDTYFCLDQIEKASFTIIVDAACFDKEPGTISVISLEQVIKKPIKPISLHDSHLLSEIEMIGGSIKGLFIGIEPHRINYSFDLSATLKEQYSKIVQGIENIITSYVR